MLFNLYFKVKKAVKAYLVTLKPPQPSASAKSHALSWTDSTVSVQCFLVNRPKGVHKAGYKGSVGLVRPPATGSDWGHGCLTGFTPLLLYKHTQLSDWSAMPSNQDPAYPLRTTAADSASTRSFIGSSARIFYMNQRANYAFFPWFFCWALS